MIEAGRLDRRLATHVRVSCQRTGLSLCGLLGRRHREHESVGSEKLYSFIAVGFSGEAQLNASNLENETMMLIYGSSRDKAAW
jgi:hypothetical protein